MFRRILIAFSAITALSFSMPVLAQTIIQHTGDTNPILEGFQGGSGLAVANDMGFAAWEVYAPGVNDQVFYRGEGLSASVKNEALTKGWVLSLTARVTGNGSHVADGFALIDFVNRRYDMNLFIDIHGDTSVRLNTSVHNGPPVTADGPTYTLAGSGSSYHQFTLKYDPISSSAALFVDGTERISNYRGHTDFVGNNAVLFGSAFVGRGRFNNVSFSVLALVSGQLLLQTAATQAYPITFEFRPMDGSGAFSRTVTLNADGTYSIPSIPRKNYSVHIKGTKWLAKNITVDTTNGSVSNANATLLAGDANNDNFADIIDLLLLIAHYNQASPNAGYSDAADFNYDGVDDITDLLLLVGNYNKQGDS